MIKLPKEVNFIVNTLEKAGMTAYCTGDCVRQSLSGIEPLDWDLAVSGGLAAVSELFPDAEKLYGEDDVLRFDYTPGGKLAGRNAELAGAGSDEDEEALIIDLHVVENVEEYLKKAAFTINAIGDSTSRGQLDPLGGKSDLSKRLIRTGKDAAEVFSRKPELMLRAISLAAEMDFDLAKATYDGILANVGKLSSVSRGIIREEFCNMMGCSGAGKALKLLASCNMMGAILGPDVKGLTHRELSDISEVAEKITKTKNIYERRLGLFYICLNKKKARAAIEYMNYEEELRGHLLDAVNEIENVFFLTNSLKMKDYLSRVGWDRYEYIHNVSKAQLAVFEGPSTRVEGRIFMLEQFKMRREPIFIEDLKITGEKLQEAGLCKTEEETHKLLIALTDTVHRDPSQNTEVRLLERAKWLKKHKFLALFRNVEWK